MGVLSLRNPEGIFINTQLFREDAIYFDKHGVYPCGDPSADPYSEYQQYWKERDRRCIEGYSAGGVRITGDHYNYLNFSQIRLTRQASANKEFVEMVKRERARAVGAKKERFFPSFWDGDYDYFHTLDIARWGCSEAYYRKLRLEIEIHPEDLSGGLHLCIAKARRKGFSFKNASVAANRYKREPESITIIAAYDSKYLYPEGTMAMVHEYIDFYNKHTAWRRRKSIDRVEHIKDGYILNLDGVEVEEGYRSQIMAISCGDNPDAIRGKDGTLILLEEGGKWPNLAPTVDSTLPTLTDGIYTTGIMLLFGTGGGNNTNWQAFEEIFYSPGAYGFMRINNKWDKGAEGTWGGFFFPSFKNKLGFIDADGNSDQVAAREFEEKKREHIKNETKNPDRLRRYKMEEAFSPSEAFLRGSSNIFPVDELDEWYRIVEAKKIWTDGVAGKLVAGEGGLLRFAPDPDAVPVLTFPHKHSDNLRGAVVQYYPPFKINGTVPNDLYIICHDPYKFDKSSNTESLGVTYVIMNTNDIVPGFKGGDIIVASYIARAESLDEYNRVLFDLAMYYNAKIGFENDSGDVIGYAKRHRHLLQYLEEEFELGWQDVVNNKLNRGYGMSMGGGKDNKKKQMGDVFIRDWLNTVRYVEKETGRVIKNLHTIKDPGLLQELIKYGPGNFDRISALRIGMYHMKELVYASRGASRSAIKSSFSKFAKSKLNG